LAKSNSSFSRSKIQKAIESGLAVVNGKIETDKSRMLAQGDTVTFSYEKPGLRSSGELAIKVVYEDRDVLVLDKPPGVVVHPAVGQDKESVAGWLKVHRPGLSKVGEDEFRPGIVHRLDAGTSGLLLIAKNVAAYKYLNRLFRERKIDKWYLALTHGIWHRKSGLIDSPIGRRAGEGKLRAGFGREARTRFEVLKVYRANNNKKNSSPDRVDNYSLLRLQLLTGRTHQIRVHCAEKGHPVAGDVLYGRRIIRSDLALINRPFLHASDLSFSLPSGGMLAVHSDLPNDLQGVLKELISV
jgi:23S rRNA pseudouridine1911/1915/1917 synthase